MRTFSAIVTDAGTDEEIALKLGVRPHQPRDWRIRNSIPPEHWEDFVNRRWSTSRELMRAAKAAKAVKTEAAAA